MHAFERVCASNPCSPDSVRNKHNISNYTFTSCEHGHAHSNQCMACVCSRQRHQICTSPDELPHQMNALRYPLSEFSMQEIRARDTPTPPGVSEHAANFISCVLIA